MEINEIKGDLLKRFDEEEFNIIMHGCNCQGIMGAGIALQIARKYPAAKHVDLLAFYETENPVNLLGNYTRTVADNKVIYNLYTQLKPGQNFEYAAFRNAFSNALDDIRSKSTEAFTPRIGIPLIGCGIGGGDFEIVRSIIKKVGHNFPADLTIVHYDNGTESMGQEEINFESKT